MKKIASKLIMLMAAAAMAVSMTACSANTGSGVAKYGSEEISMGEAEFLMRYEQWMTEAYYGQIYAMMGYENMWESPSSNGTQTNGAALHDETMAVILQTRVLMDHAAEYGIDGLTDEQKAKVEENVDALMENFPKFAEHVSADRDAMISYLEKNAVASLVIKAVKDAADVQVTDEECQKFKVEYIKVNEPKAEEEDTEEETTEEEAGEPELDGYELVMEVLKCAEAGEEFTDIASEYANATSNTSTYLVTGETSTDDVYTAAQGLEAGKYTYVEVAEDNCWYIVKRVNDLDEEATESMRSSVIDQKQADAFNEVYADWAASAQEFVVNEVKWAECTIDGNIFEMETEAETAEAETETAEAETEAE